MPRSLNSYSWERGSDPLQIVTTARPFGATVKQISSCNSSLGLSTFSVYKYSGRDRPTQLHSRDRASSQRALSELQTLMRAKQYVPQDYKIYAPKRYQNAKCISQLNINRLKECRWQAQSRSRTTVPAIKRRLPKLTAFQMLIRQCCRTRGQITSVTLNTPRRHSTNSLSFPLSLSFSLPDPLFLILILMIST